MTLRTKTLATIFMAMSVLVVAVYFAVAGKLVTEFQNIEAANLTRDVERAERAFQDEIDQLASKSQDWAAWDDTYEFMKNGNQDYVSSNITYEAAFGLGLRYILYFRPNQTMLAGYRLDPDKQVITKLGRDFEQDFAEWRALTKHEKVDSSTSGIIRLRDELLILVSKPILTSNRTGPIRGTLIFAKTISHETIDKLAQQTRLSLSGFDLKRDALADRAKKVSARLGAHEIALISPTANEEYGYVNITDFTGKPALLLEVTSPRTIYQQGIKVKHSLIEVLIIVGLSLGAVMLALLERMIVSRLGRLGREVRTIAIDSDVSKRVTVVGSDEVSDLARQINKMLDELRQSQVALEVAKEVSEQASLAKSKFVANITHELRTPIQGVVGMLDILKPLETAPHKLRFISMASESARSLLDLINDVLDFSKIEAGKVELEEISCDLTAVIKASVHTVAQKADAKRLPLLVSVDPELPKSIRGDPTRLRQVLVNLLSNAVKFTSVGHVALNVKVLSQDRSKAQVRFEVRDTGIGIPPEKKQAIFEAFTQVDGTVTRKYQGTGLGLTISRDLVAAMGGELQLDSVADHGTEFFFTLSFPIEEAAQPWQWSINSALVIDETTSAEHLVKELGRMGVVATAHPTLAHAWEKLHEVKSIESCLLIINGDEVDAQKLSELCRSIEKKQGKGPAVVLTLDSSRLAQSDALVAHGFAHVIFRPVLVTDIYDAIVGRLNCASESGTGPRPFGKSLRIIVADDTKTNQIILEHMLTALGHKVVSVNNGRELVTHLDESGYFSPEAHSDYPFDLVITDVQMPLLDGLGATRIIRARESRQSKEQNCRKAIPIVAVSAHTSVEQHEGMRKAGMDAILTKPVDKTKLAKLIGEFFGIDQVALAISSYSPESLPEKFFDHNLLVERFGGDRELVNEILATALEELDPLMVEFIDCRNRQDWVDLGRLAHTLKGSLNNAGASAAAEVAHRLQEAPELNEAERNDLTETLISQIREVASEIKRYLDCSAGCDGPVSTV